MEAFTTSLAHLMAEMERIDLLIQMQVWRARQSQLLDNDFAGLVLTDEEIDQLLSQSSGAPRWVRGTDDWTAQEARAALRSLTLRLMQRRDEALANGVFLRLALLSEIFVLPQEAMDILLICLAPELDSRYGQIFGYLQNDVNRKYPTIDLVLSLLCTNFNEKIQLRRWFAEETPLILYQFIQINDDSDRPLLTRQIKISTRLVDFLLESDRPETLIKTMVQIIVPEMTFEKLILPDDLASRMKGLAMHEARVITGLTMYLQGDYGVGRQAVAEALCAMWKRRLLVVDTSQVLNLPDFALAIRLILREALLTGSLLYWNHFDVLLDDRRQAEYIQFFRQFDEYRGLMFLAGEQTWQPRDLASHRQFLHVRFSRPDFMQRLALWQSYLPDADETLRLIDISNNFRFTAGQIEDAISTAKGLAMADNPAASQLKFEHLQRACRLQSNRRLSTLAQPIQGRYTWDDIVLPEAQKTILREIYNQVRHRWRVYQDWGFDNKLSLGKGLNVLFAGPSGTGKTMAAEIIANALGFDLYKIDLSTVISKYIGETEKHLAQIFDEAQSSNAILFFDEADAVFGKRSEVSDAHDRFANIQVSFLLQRMEEYDGMVVLTTNLRKNMDEAFVRRMHFIVEFPFPQAEYREQIWRHVFPKETPLSDDIDWRFLAQRFDITGGNIRNIALAAAFFAVEDGKQVEMEHILRAVQREFQKMGKIVTDTLTFRQK